MIPVNRLDRLILQSQNVSSTAFLRVYYRVRLATGALQDGMAEQDPSTDREVNTLTVPLPAGELVAVNVQQTVAGVATYRTFCRLILALAGTDNNAVYCVLAQGYVSSRMSIGYPQTPYNPSEEWWNYSNQSSPSDPAAGAGYNMAGSAGTVRRYRTCQFTLTTDATAANRQVRVVFATSGSTEYARWVSPVVQAASLAYLYTFSSVGSSRLSGLADHVTVEMPQLWQLESDRVLINANNLQAGDQFSGLNVWYDEVVAFWQL